MAYRIMTDIACDLPLEYTKARNIKVLPISTSLEDKEYMIGNDPSAPNYLDPHKFYQALLAGAASKTAQINLVTLLDEFRAVAQAGDDLLYISFSSGLSGTYNNACLAASQIMEEYPERKFLVRDSLSASLGQGLLVYLVAESKDSGASLEEAAAYTEKMRLRVHHWFTVDDLNFLRRGGRVSGAAAVIGTMLSIKPVLNIDDEGHLIPKQKMQGRKRALKALVDHMEETCHDPQKYPVMISHGDAPEDAEWVAQQVEKRFGVKPKMFNYISPVIGCHAGPGTVALFYVTDDPRD